MATIFSFRFPIPLPLPLSPLLTETLFSNTVTFEQDKRKFITTSYYFWHFLVWTMLFNMCAAIVTSLISPSPKEDQVSFCFCFPCRGYGSKIFVGKGCNFDAPNSGRTLEFRAPSTTYQRKHMLEAVSCVRENRCVYQIASSNMPFPLLYR